MHRLAVFLSTLALAGAASASLQPLNLDFEADWADLPANSFLQIAGMAAAPGGLHWGDAWYGQTTAPVLGSNNELRLGATGSMAVDYFDLPFYLDSVDFRSMQNGGHIEFDFIVRLYDATAVNGVGASVVFHQRIDGALDNGVPSLLFTTVTDTATLGPLHSISFGNFKAGGQTTDRNLFVMDNLQLRLEPTVSVVPEPASAALALAGLGLLAGRRMVRRR